MSIDAALVGALHIEYLGKQDVLESEHPHHSLFQTSTIDALLSGNYEGDVSFAQLRTGGNFGLGTFQATDFELLRRQGCPKEVAPRAVGTAQLAVGSIMPVCEL